MVQSGPQSWGGSLIEFKGFQEKGQGQEVGEDLDHFPVQGGPFVGQDQAVGGPEVQPDYAVLTQDRAVQGGCNNLKLHFLISDRALDIVALSRYGEVRISIIN
jgi:hypothetical protein